MNEAHRVLKAARKAGLGPPGAASGAPPPRRRPETTAAPPPPPPRPRPIVEPSEADLAEPGHHKAPAVLVAVGLLVAALVGGLAIIGAFSSSPDGARQREVLGPLAHRLWEAQRLHDDATVWSLAEPQFKAAVPLDVYLAHVRACPKEVPPREVARMAKVGPALWEVESVDPAGEPGLSYFKQVHAYEFGAVVDDPDLDAFLAAPVSSAPDQPWCHR